MTAVRVLRHTAPVSQRLVFGALNVRSANNKVDEILDIRREHGLDVMLMSETWHDGDSVSIRRLRAEGLNVLERDRQLALRHFASTTAASPSLHHLACVCLLWL